MPRNGTTDLAQRWRGSSSVHELDVTEASVAHLLVLEGPSAIRGCAVDDVACLFDLLRRDGGLEGVADGFDLVVHFCGVDVAIRRGLARRDYLAR